MCECFVSYNTDSILDCYFRIFCANKNTQIYQMTNLDDKKEVFVKFRQYYISNKGIHKMYVDILDNTDIPYNPKINYCKIEKCKFVLALIGQEEISFWQLQELYFASYFNKKIIFMTTQKFMRLLKRKKLDKQIFHMLKKQ